MDRITREMQRAAEARLDYNMRLPLPWIHAQPAHDGIAVLCGGGPSLADDPEAISAIGGTVIGMNGSATWLANQGIPVDCQIIVDERPEMAGLVEPRADRHIFSAGVYPGTIAALNPRTNAAPALFHHVPWIELCFPPGRVCTLIEPGETVGTASLGLAYILGFRTFHLFGFDSSNRADATHAYPQPMNAGYASIEIKVDERIFNCSVQMAQQAKNFEAFTKRFLDCDFHMHGDGLLQAVWRGGRVAWPSDLSWQHELFIGPDGIKVGSCNPMPRSTQGHYRFVENRLASMMKANAA